MADDLKSIAETTQYWLCSSLPEHWGELCGSDEAAWVWLEEWLPRSEFSLRAPAFASSSFTAHLI
ncbi:MAG: hypothetical protein RQ801_01625 [Spirochaetaceae bacterium]|nr:hypothetical protein [Spirochaetaceae bacterium]MDT8296972.1 hypothetical protein [Spirochaetaceae bacterium]